MYDDSQLWTLITRFAGILPTLITCLVGIVVLNTRIIPAKARTMAIFGLVLVAVGPVLGVLYGFVLQQYVAAGNGYTGSGWQGMQIAYAVVAQGIHVAALILLIAAICQRETTVADVGNVENPYG